MRIKRLIILLSLVVYSLEASQPAALVNTAKVVKGIVNPLEEFIGTLNFSKTSKIASATSGLVTNINFEAGDRVRKGDILLSIDSDLLDMQVESAKLNISLSKISLENSQRDYNRYKELIEKKSISQKLFDDSLFKYNIAQQNILLAQSKLNELLITKSKKSIKAPFDAVVVEKAIEISEWVNTGKTIATLVDTTEVDMMFNLPTSYIYKLDIADSYNIDLKGKQLKSKLYASIAKGDRRTRTFPVKFKASVDNDFLYDGMEVKINLPRSKKQEALMVPRDAVIKRFGQNVIFTNFDGIANMIPVEIIGYTKESVAVQGKGLKAGVDVVVKGNERIFPKQPIKSLNK